MKHKGFLMKNDIIPPCNSQLSNQVDAIKNSIDNQFKEAISPKTIQAELDTHGNIYRNRIFSPPTTLYTWMHQSTSEDSCLRNAVLYNNAQRIAAGLEPSSVNTAAYSNARHELPTNIIKKLFYKATEETELIGITHFSSKIPWLDGRTVKIVDGTTFIMDDTEENQEDFPQTKNQEPGAGFPIARLVAIFSLLTGQVLDTAIGPYSGKETGEHALLREILHSLESNDVLLGDAYYASYFLMANLICMGVDFIFESHGARKIDFRTGQRVDKEDHLIELKKPVKPTWMDQKTYEEFPDSIEIRETKVIIERPGFRPKTLIFTTSFLDNKKISKQSLSNLYYHRWMCELYFRSIKTIMNMDFIRCKTPDMVIKDVWVHLIAYNAIRKIILQAAIAKGILPNHISFKGAIQTINQYAHLFQNEEIQREQIYDYIFNALVANQIGKRPGRHEPRVKKRRPKAFPLLKGKRDKLKTPKSVIKMDNTTTESIFTTVKSSKEVLS